MASSTCLASWLNGTLIDTKHDLTVQYPPLQPTLASEQ